VLGDWYEQGSVVRWDEDGLELTGLPRPGTRNESETARRAP